MSHELGVRVAGLDLAERVQPRRRGQVFDQRALVGMHQEEDVVDAQRHHQEVEGLRERGDGDAQKPVEARGRHTGQHHVDDARHRQQHLGDHAVERVQSACANRKRGEYDQRVRVCGWAGVVCGVRVVCAYR